MCDQLDQIERQYLELIGKAIRDGDSDRAYELTVQLDQYKTGYK